MRNGSPRRSTSPFSRCSRRSWRSAAEAEGVAGILDIMRMVAPPLGVFVLIGALSSQLSAAVADSIGSGGLMNEVSRRKISVPAAFAIASALAIAVVWLTDPVPGRRGIVARVRAVLCDAVRRWR